MSKLNKLFFLIQSLFCIYYSNAQNSCFNCSSSLSGLNLGLVACYPFNGNANDNSGNNNHGVNYGAILTTDRFGNPNSAYYFNGNSRIQAPHSSSLNVSEISISMWVKYENYDLTQILTKRNWSDAYNEKFAFDTKDFYVKRNGNCYPNNAWQKVNYSVLPQLNIWTFLTVTYDGSVSKFYLNGELKESANFGSYLAMDNCNAGELIFGATWSSFPFYFKGSMDDVRIYNRALTSLQVSNLYQFSATNLPYTVNAGSDFSVCKEDSFLLAGNGLGSMLWSPAAAVANPTAHATRAKIEASTQFVLTGTFGSCIARDTILVSTLSLNANAGPDVQICKRGVTILAGSASMGSPSWLPIRNISGNLSFNPSVNPDSNTTYILTVRSGNCISRDTVNVSVNPLDVQIINKDTAICLGDTITLFANTNAASFNWLNTTQMLEPFLLTPRVFPNTAQKYLIEVSDPECVIRDSINISIKTLDLTTLEDHRICKGNTLAIFGDSVFGASYEWFPKFGLATPYQRQTLASPDTTVVYTLLMQHGKCSARDSLQILVDPKPVVDAGRDVTHCYLDSALLLGSINFADSFKWEPTSGLANAFLLGTKVSASSTLRYQLFAYQGVCQSYDSVEVIALPKVESNFQASTYLSIAPALVQFQNSSIGASKYLWDFGDSLGISKDENPSYNFNTQGTYRVRLIASNALDCADTAYQTIRLGGNSEVFIPNAFTPNQDGLNNQFVVSFNANDYEWVAYSVYNRWGALLFQTSMPGGNWWDGNYKSTHCAQGVYFYTLEAKPLGMPPKSYSGTLTLLR
jgi:gliding motility-associated-like protein